MTTFRLLRFDRAFLLAIVMVALSSCTWSLYEPGGAASPTGAATGQPAPTPPSLPLAATNFRVVLPAPLPPGANLGVAVLDEVTGLPFNPTVYPLTQVDALHYSGQLALPAGGTAKYRYIHTNGQTVQEDSGFDKLVRYRMLFVPGPGEVSDVISSWEGEPFTGETGRAQGKVLNATSGQPAMGALVALGGQQAFTDSLGEFSVDKLVPGTHNMVVYALDGTLAPFQQGVTIAAGAVTPVGVALQPAQSVRVTFNVTVPADTVAGAPLRLAGNLLQLGNTFSDLTGGVNTLASRMPVMTPAGDGRYTLSLDLPAGAYLQYKYTLGDGLINSEHRSDGPFLVREMIVSEREVVVEDAVAAWQSGNGAPILFQVDVPAGTPGTDHVSLQLSQFGWTEAIPMWSLGNNRWVYKLFGPLSTPGSFSYRYCRNGQCGSADDVATAGYDAQGRHGTITLTGQDLRDAVGAWQWFTAEPQPAVVGADVAPRASGFVAGIELQKYYDPSFLQFSSLVFQDIQGLGANWVMLDPTWTVMSNSPLVFEPSPQNDPLGEDVAANIRQARETGLSVALFPRVNFASTDLDWQNAAPADIGQWVDRYRAFALYHADLAAGSDAQALILGGEVPPTLSDAPESEERFRGILAEVRQHFPGVILWAQPYDGAMQPYPAFLDAVDGIYLLWSAPLAQDNDATVEEMQGQAGSLLDADILPFIVAVQKTVIISVAYPSADGAAQGCIPGAGGGCLDSSALARPLPDASSVAVDQQEQADLYQAVLGAINTRNWISGVASRGYYPPAILQDKSESIHGKLAANYLWYWYPRFLGQSQ